MKRKTLTAAIAALALLLSACAEAPDKAADLAPESAASSFGITSGEIQPASAPEIEIDLPENKTSDFRIESDNKNGFSASGNIYTITAEGEYNCFGSLYDGQLAVSAPETAKVIINLCGCTITSSSVSPIEIKTADKTEISAKKDTENKIYDLRALTDGEDAQGAGIYAECDLTIKGNGSLEIISSYNNGVHTKDDLEIKNLTLSVKAANNALKGNDSVTITSGVITAVSTCGDAIKTTSTDANKNGERRGAVKISGGSTALYAARDGIDAASDVIISDEAAIEVYTDEYSPYTTKTTDTDNNSNNNTNNNQNNNNNNTRPASDAMTGATPQGGGNDRPTKPDKGNFGGEMPQFPDGGQMPEGGFDKGNKPNRGGFGGQFPEGGFDKGNRPDKGNFGGGGFDGHFGGGFGGGHSVSEYSCKGIKAANEIIISGGSVTIRSKDDALHASFSDALESTGKNGLGNITISGGTLAVYTDDDGIHADQDLKISGGAITVTNSYEGLEANRIYISGGNSTVKASDDAVNANSKGAYAAYIEISGGYLDAAVPNGDTDTIDSNGTLLISGGTVILKNGQMNGRGMGGGTIDSERGATFTGGTVIAVGCIGEALSGAVSSTTQTFESGEYTLRCGSDELAGFTLDSTYKAYMFASDKFESGRTYTVYKGSEALFSFTK